jgi:DNA-binding transcriptional regulator YhcF (GntR family)
MGDGFIISKADGRPMYLQIMEQVRQRVANGDWPRGHDIPSIRQLAIDLNVSVITVKRAYLELEREGVIVTQHGRGSSVATDPDIGPRLWEEDLARHLDHVVRLASLLRLSPEELITRLRQAADRLEEART